MAKMHPASLNEYTPPQSEIDVYYALKNQLPDYYDVFWSVEWTRRGRNGKLEKGEADFIVASPKDGFLCLEVKGGANIDTDGENWVLDQGGGYGLRDLEMSPYKQADKSMYYFRDVYYNENYVNYPGIIGSAAVFPYYPVGENVRIDNRDRACTIDCRDMNNLESRIKKLFRFWGGSRYGKIHYTEAQHKMLLELIRNKVALAAAAGSLVKYKDKQLDVINRVQENYIYFISNIRQFLIRGGAGTGKTWIAMKMAGQEARKNGNAVLFLCASEKLADKVREYIGDYVDVYDVRSLFEEIIGDFEAFDEPLYTGVLDSLREDHPLFDAIFVDEAQDFTEEWAELVRQLLRVPDESRLGVFYDDVQIFREDSFGDGFGIPDEPYLLRENIRNTANIYDWTAEKTNLGMDVISNPIEGPEPKTEYIREQGQLTIYLEDTFRKFILDENLPNTSLVILTDDIDWLFETYSEGFSEWDMTTGELEKVTDIRVSSVEDYKGLESDMVIYIHKKDTSDNQNYIAYTRAKYYLIELIRLF